MSHITQCGETVMSISVVILNVFQCRDGRKSVPHVISVTGNVDRGLMAFLSNSLQTLTREDSRQRLKQRKVEIFNSCATCKNMIFVYTPNIVDNVTLSKLWCSILSGSETAPCVGSSQSGFRYWQRSYC